MPIQQLKVEWATNLDEAVSVVCAVKHSFASLSSKAVFVPAEDRLSFDAECVRLKRGLNKLEHAIAKAISGYDSTEDTGNVTQPKVADAENE